MLERVTHGSMHHHQCQQKDTLAHLHSRCMRQFFWLGIVVWSVDSLCENWARFCHAPSSTHTSRADTRTLNFQIGGLKSHGSALCSGKRR